MTLEQYLRGQLRVNPELRLRVHEDRGDAVTAYFHPAFRSGLTFDVIVRGNSLELAPHSVQLLETAGETRPCE